MILHLSSFPLHFPKNVKELINVENLPEKLKVLKHTIAQKPNGKLVRTITHQYRVN